MHLKLSTTFRGHTAKSVDQDVALDARIIVLNQYLVSLISKKSTFIHHLIRYKKIKNSHCVYLPDTLCYCDEMCNREKDGDCCPDYVSFCLNMPSPLMEGCLLNGVHFSKFDAPVKDNCNLW